jgi:hypothetical protein
LNNDSLVTSVFNNYVTTSTNINNLSTYSALNINNLNATSTTMFNSIATTNTNLNNLSTVSLLSTTTKFSYIAVSNNFICTSTSTLYGASTHMSTLNVQGQTTLVDVRATGIISYPVNVWVQDNSNRQRFFFDDAAKTYFRSGGTGVSTLDGFTFRNGQGGDIVTIDGLGAIYSNMGLNSNAITSRSTINAVGTITCGALTTNNIFKNDSYLTSNVLSNVNINYGFVHSNVLSNLVYPFVSSNVLSNINIKYGF